MSYKLLRRARVARGLSQTEVARALRLSISFYSNIERGLKWVPAARIEDFAKVLGLTIAEVYLTINRKKAA